MFTHFGTYINSENTFKKLEQIKFNKLFHSFYSSLSQCLLSEHVNVNKYKEL
jgi:hypothetical protein